MSAATKTTSLPAKMVAEDAAERLPNLLERRGTVPMQNMQAMLRELSPTRKDTMQLCYAAAAGDCLKVKMLLDQNSDPNIGDYMGKTPLHIACGVKTAGAHEVVRVLLESGSDANAVDNLGQTPLDIVSRARNFGVKALLEEHGAKLRREELETRARECYWLLNPKDITLKKQIGKTLKSAVHLAQWKSTTVVVKCAKMQQSDMVTTLRKSHSLALDGAAKDVSPRRKEDDELEEGITKEMLHEIQLLASLRHPDLVLFLGACLDPAYPIMFVTEFMDGGDLEHYMLQMRAKHQAAHWGPPLWRLVDWSTAIARALTFLHGFTVPIVHRDLKPLNLLLTKNLQLKMTDFGISKMLEGVGEDHQRMTGGVGSYLYMAPEVVRYEEYNEKVDLYSFGLIMYYLSSGRRPFHHITMNPEVILQKFCKREEPRPLISECHRVLRGIIEPCLHVDKFQRPSAEEVSSQLTEVVVSRGASCESCTVA